VCRVFWRAGVPWVLLRCRNGVLLPLPWSATDLPVPVPDTDALEHAREAVLLTPTALRALARCVLQHAPDDDRTGTGQRRRR
jgi:hypothetical protein